MERVDHALENLAGMTTDSTSWIGACVELPDAPQIAGREAKG
jgi:hypothetical protein